MRLPVAASSFVLGSLLLLAAGCETAPTNQNKTAAVAPKPALSPAPAPKITAPKLTNTAPAPTVKAMPTPKLSRETNALLRRFTDSDDNQNLQHEVSDTTAFPSALKSLQPGA